MSEGFDQSSLKVIAFDVFGTDIERGRQAAPRIRFAISLLPFPGPFLRFPAS